MQPGRPPLLFFVLFLRLPISIELAARRPVGSAGGTTRVEFTAELRLGLAGKIEPARPSADQVWALAALDANGREAARSRATTFGYYRLDGLPPGRYTVVLRRPGGTQIAEIPVELTNAFLFNQDLSAPSP